MNDDDLFYIHIHIYIYIFTWIVYRLVDKIEPCTCHYHLCNIESIYEYIYITLFNARKCVS